MFPYSPFVNVYLETRTITIEVELSLGIFFLAAALDFLVFVVQTTPLKQSNSKELERTRCFWIPKMKKPTKCRTGVLSQFGASIFAAQPIRSSNFALGEREIKKNFPLLQQISIQKNFALCITLLLLLLMGSAYGLKIHITAERMRNW